MVTANLDEFLPRTRGRIHEHGDGLTNIANRERILCGAAGAGLAAWGLYRGGSPGAGLVAIGAAIAARGVTGRSPLYRRLGIDTAHAGQARPFDYLRRGVHVEHSVTINKPREECFRFWRDFQNLPRFMKHLQHVHILDGTRSRWAARGPAGYRVEWDARITNEQENSLIAWESFGSADVNNIGSVRFEDAPGGRGTIVRVRIAYIPPAGKLGIFIARLFGREPHQQIRSDLRRFKSLLEAGEIPTVQGQSSGRRHPLREISAGRSAISATRHAPAREAPT